MEAKKITAKEAFDKTVILLKGYKEGDLHGGNPMQYIEKFAEYYHSQQAQQTVSDEEIEGLCFEAFPLGRNEFLEQGAKIFRKRFKIVLQKTLPHLSPKALDNTEREKAKAILIGLLAQSEEIISNPLRFKGVSIEKIKQVFKDYGIHIKIPF